MAQFVQLNRNVARREAHLVTENHSLRAEVSANYNHFFAVGGKPAMQNLNKMIQRAAPSSFSSASPTRSSRWSRGGAMWAYLHARSKYEFRYFGIEELQDLQVTTNHRLQTNSYRDAFPDQRSDVPAKKKNASPIALTGEAFAHV